MFESLKSKFDAGVKKEPFGTLIIRNSNQLHSNK